MKIVSNRKGVREATLTLIQKLTGNKNILTIPVELIHYTGSLDCALFLSQMLYWTERTPNPRGWVYKTYKEWKQEIHLSEFEVRKAVKALGKDGKGILETKLKKANGSPTVHYRLLADEFSDSILNFLQERTLNKSVNQDSESEESLTETTTDITTDKREQADDSHSDSITLDSPSLETSPLDTDALAAKSAEMPAALVPENFQPTRDMLYWAAEECPYVSARLATEKFINHYRARGMMLKDWNAQWRKWMRDEADYAKRYKDNAVDDDIIGENLGNSCGLEQAVCEYVYNESESFVVHRSEIEAAFSDLSKTTITRILTKSVNDEWLASPAENLYYNLMAYSEYAEYREGVDRWLTERGLESPKVA